MLEELPYSQAKLLIAEGDVLLFRGASFFSKFITKYGQTKYSHVAVASWHNGDDKTNGLLECVEFREWKGGRTVNLGNVVQDGNIIDVYRPAPHKEIIKWDDNIKRFVVLTVPFRGKKVTNTMRKMTNLPYGWRRIFWLAKYKIPFRRLIYNIDDFISDELRELVYPVCSTAIAYAFNSTGYDLLQNRNDNAMEPGHIANSPLLSPLFTITQN